MIHIAIIIASDRCDTAAVTKLVRRFVTENTDSTSPPGNATFSMADNKAGLSRYLHVQKTLNA